MSHLKRTQRILLIIFSVGLLFVIIPAVLFANSQDEVGRSGHSPISQTVPTRTPILTDTGWLPVIMNQVTVTPTVIPPTETPTPTNTPDTSACLPNPEIDADNQAVETELANTINSYRGENALAGYTINDRLVQAARRHAHDMATFSQSQLNTNPHLGTDGTLANQRVVQSCYEGSLGTEIVGWGFTSVTAMMEGFWKTSPVHNGLLLNTQRNEYGPTYLNPTGALYDHYWVVTFGSSTSINQDTGFHCTYLIEDEAKNQGMSISTWQSTPCSE